jgi:hypothetical protein
LASGISGVSAMVNGLSGECFRYVTTNEDGN